MPRARFDSDPSDRAAFELLEEELFLAADWARLVPLYQAHLAASAEKRPPADRARLLFRMGQSIEEGLQDPSRAMDAYREALALDPESLAVAEQILYLGRLYERNPHAADFSVIKCYLLNPYLEPTAVSPEKRDAMRRELFDHPDLDRCLRLCGDQTAFLTRYLTRLGAQYIDLFLHGSSQHMHRFFGFSLDSRAPKLLAVPAARMLAAMRDDTALTPEQRSLLMHAFYAAFNSQLNGDVQWLRQEMQARGVTLD